MILYAAVNKSSCGFGDGSNLGKFEAGILEIKQWLAKCITLSGVGQCHCKRTFNCSSSSDTNDGAFIRQIRHQLKKSLTFHTT